MTKEMSNVWAIEGVLLAMAGCCALVGVLIWKKHASPKTPVSNGQEEA